jgi:PKD repeat protein
LSSTSWGDYDNDGDLDLLLTGETSTGSYVTKIYKNNPLGTFVAASISFVNVAYGSAAWGDYDNDNDLDILLTGYAAGDSYTKIYRNNGSDSFTEMTTIAINGCYQSSVSWIDYDNDGDIDMLVSGYFKSEGSKTKLYRNNMDNTFTQISVNSFQNISGKNSWSDFNNDGFPDLLISGYGNGGPFSRLFQNDKNGGFIMRDDLVIPAVFNCDIKWGDFNSDGYPDLVLTGNDYDYQKISIVLRNNSGISFSSITSVLTGMQESSASWGDYDSDGDIDLLLSGQADGLKQTLVYKNDGNETFTVESSIILSGLSRGTADWIDVDNDRDLDIFITGSATSIYTGGASKIYLNGTTIKNSLPAAPSSLSVIKERYLTNFRWNPVKSDLTPYRGLGYNIRIGKTPGNNEIMTSMSNSGGFLKTLSSGNAGQDTSFILNGILPGNYFWSVQSVDNNHAGGVFAAESNFVIDSIPSDNLEFKVLSSSALRIKWRNGNGQRHILFCTQGATGTAYPAHGRTYTADPVFGQGDKILNTGWYCVYNGKNDTTIVSGLAPEMVYKFYIIDYTGNSGSEKYFRTPVSSNNGVLSTSPFTDQTNMSFTNMQDGAIAFGDYNNDGYLDLLISGRGTNSYTELYKNNGNNNFIKMPVTNLTFVSQGNLIWADLDNDQDPDIILSGATTGDPQNPVPITRIYRNNGNETFTEIANITGIYLGTISVADYDKDGDLDILEAGATGGISNPSAITKLYRNDGSFTYIEQSGPGFTSSYLGSSDWSDYDNDGDQDLLLAGKSGISDNPWTKVYINNGNNSFSLASSVALPGLEAGQVSWGDYNNDDYTDILLTGSGISKVYRNNNDGSFTEEAGASLTGLITGNAIWADYNNDGFLDIILTGSSGSGLITQVYTNNGNGKFIMNNDINMVGVYGGGLASGDYDNDGDIDLAITGANYTKVYRNNGVFRTGVYNQNQKPAAPLSPASLRFPDRIRLEWNHVIHDETPYKTMTYNIRLGTTVHGSDIISSNSDNTTGYRKLVTAGNSSLNNYHIIKGLSSGKYYWQVQAVDQAFAGGAWSEVDSFVINNVQAFFKTDTVCHGFTTHFTDQSVATDGIASWKWDFTDGSSSTLQNPVHTYSTGGVYPVKLIITSTSGDKDSLVQNVIVKMRPATGFTAPNTCQGTPVSITNTTNVNGLTVSSWYWNFGDSTISIAQQPPAHGYLGPGSYNVQLKALATNGCLDSTSKSVIVAPYPVAVITSNAPLTFCKGDSVTLSVTKNTKYAYRWLFGGVGITGGDSSKYIAKLSGNYSVEVINTDANCKTISDPVTVNAQEAPASPAIFAAGPLQFCQGDSVSLSITPTTGYSYQWRLNGGAVGINTYHHYVKTAGSYTIEVTNSTGCKATSVSPVIVTVHSLPALSAVNLSGGTTFCEGSSVTMSVAAVSGISYKWKNETGFIAGAGSNSYNATASGKYQVVATNSNNCSVSSQPIEVTSKTFPLKPVVKSENYAPGTCPGDMQIRLYVDQPVSGYAYQWYRNGSPVAGANTSSYQDYLDQGGYKVEANLDGCRNISDSYDLTFPDDAPKKPVIFTQNGPNVWYLVSSVTTASAYRWYYNGTIIPGAATYYYVAGKNFGKYYVLISNDKGCYVRSDEVTIPTGTTDLEDVDLFEGTKLYPNPTTGLFTIEMDNQLYGGLNISVIAQNGQQVLKIRFEKTTVHFSSQVDLGGQSKGVYIIKLQIDKYSAVKRVVVE